MSRLPETEVERLTAEMRKRAEPKAADPAPPAAPSLLEALQVFDPEAIALAKRQAARNGLEGPHDYLDLIAQNVPYYHNRAYSAAVELTMRWDPQLSRPKAVALVATNNPAWANRACFDKNTNRSRQRAHEYARDPRQIGIRRRKRQR